LERNNEPVVHALLAAGAPATATSWVLAVRLDGCNAPVLTSLLRAAGVPSEALAVPADGEEGRTALMEAARYGSLGSVQLLLDAGASVAPRNERGQDALMWAARAKPCMFGDGALEVAVVSALLVAGADVNARDEQGWGVLHPLAHSACGAPWAAKAVQLVCERGAAQRRARDGLFPFEVPAAAGGACSCGLHAGRLVGAAVTAAAEARSAAHLASGLAEAARAAEAKAAAADAAAKAATAASSAALARAQAAYDQEAADLDAAPLALSAAQSPAATGSVPS
jgi:hypothetical protein